MIIGVGVEIIIKKFMWPECLDLVTKKTESCG